MTDKKNVRHKIDFKSKREYFYNFVISYFLINIILTTIFYFFHNASFLIFIKVLLSVFLFTSIFYLIPLIVIFRNYMKYNEHLELIIEDSDSYSVNLKNNLTETLTPLMESDIKLINSNLSYTLYDNRLRWFYWDELFYYELVLKTNERIFISCLLCDDIFEHIPNVKNQRIKRIFPIIKTDKTVGNNS